MLLDSLRHRALERTSSRAVPGEGAVATPISYFRPYVGIRRILLDAGLPTPILEARLPVGAGRGSYLYSWIAETVRGLLPIIEREGLGIADEIHVDSLRSVSKTRPSSLGVSSWVGGDRRRG
jgi:hypothetical protein